MRISLLAIVLVGALAPPASAGSDDSSERANISVSTAFVMGSFKIADNHGFQAPGGHFDLGFRVRRWRLAAEAQLGLWSKPDDDPSTYHGGGMRRLGMALQWSFKELLVPPHSGRPKASRFHGYVELGLGRHSVETDLLSVARNDLMLGIGIAPELRLGPALLGGTFGVRMLISRAPTTTIARGATASDPSLDVAMLYVFGLRFGH